MKGQKSWVHSCTLMKSFKEENKNLNFQTKEWQQTLLRKAPLLDLMPPHKKCNITIFKKAIKNQKKKEKRKTALYFR